MNLLELERLHPFRIIDTWNDKLIQKAVEIYEEGLGQKYISRDDLIKFSEDKEKYILIGAMVGDDLAGVMIAYPMESQEYGKYSFELFENEVPDLFEGRKVGLIKSVSVQKKYRRRGIGTQLILESMQGLKNKGCDLLFAVAWDSGLRDSSPSIFKDLKFIDVAYIPNYWTEGSKKRDENGNVVGFNYTCPVDGEGEPCICPAIFFFKNA